jgi:hypothetical protein
MSASDMSSWMTATIPVNNSRTLLYGRSTNGLDGWKYAGLPALLQELGTADGIAAAGRFVAIPAPRVPVCASPTELSYVKLVVWWCVV